MENDDFVGIIQEAKVQIDEGGWEDLHYLEEFGVSVFVKDFPKSIYRVEKAIVTVNASLHNAIDFVWGLPEAEFKQIDPSIISIKNYDEKESYRIRETVTKNTWPLWPRQMVVEMKQYLDGENNSWILEKNILTDKVPIQESQYIREILSLGAYQFVAVGTKQTKITRIVHRDPAGNTGNNPASFVYNYANRGGSLGLIMKGIKQGIEKKFRIYSVSMVRYLNEGENKVSDFTNIYLLSFKSKFIKLLFYEDTVVTECYSE